MSDQTKSEMKQYLPGFATAKNPLDATTALFRNEEKVIGLLKALENEPEIGGVVLGGNIGTKFMDVWQIFCQSIVKAKEQGFTKPAFVTPPYEATRHPEYRKILESAGIPLMSAVSTGLQCLSKLTDFIRYNPDEKTLKIAAPEKYIKIRHIPLIRICSKNELAAIGLPIPFQKLVKNVDELSDALKEMHLSAGIENKFTGYPS